MEVYEKAKHSVGASQFTAGYVLEKKKTCFHIDFYRNILSNITCSTQNETELKYSS